MAIASSVQLRRDARLERRRRRIVMAGLALFANRGFNAASVEEIVAEARMSKSAFYEFFTSKEHCFREVLAEEGGSLIHKTLTAAATGHNHHERLRLGITTFVLSCFGEASVARVFVGRACSDRGIGGIERRSRQGPPRAAGPVCRRCGGGGPPREGSRSFLCGQGSPGVRARGGRGGQRLRRLLPDPSRRGRRIARCKSVQDLRASIFRAW